MEAVVQRLAIRETLSLECAWQDGCDTGSATHASELTRCGLRALLAAVYANLAEASGGERHAELHRLQASACWELHEALAYRDHIHNLSSDARGLPGDLHHHAPGKTVQDVEPHFSQLLVPSSQQLCPTPAVQPLNTSSAQWAYHLADNLRAVQVPPLSLPLGVALPGEGPHGMSAPQAPRLGTWQDQASANSRTPQAVAGASQPWRPTSELLSSGGAWLPGPLSARSDYLTPRTQFLGTLQPKVSAGSNASSQYFPIAPRRLDLIMAPEVVSDRAPLSARIGSATMRVGDARADPIFQSHRAWASHITPACQIESACLPGLESSRALSPLGLPSVVHARAGHVSHQRTTSPRPTGRTGSSSCMPMTVQRANSPGPAGHSSMAMTPQRATSPMHASHAASAVPMAALRASSPMPAGYTGASMLLSRRVGSPLSADRAGSAGVSTRRAGSPSPGRHLTMATATGRPSSLCAPAAYSAPRIPATWTSIGTAATGRDASPMPLGAQSCNNATNAGQGWPGAWRFPRAASPQPFPATAATATTTGMSRGRSWNDAAATSRGRS